MSINIDPSFYKSHEDSAHILPKTQSFDELQDLKNKPTETIFEGDIFTYEGVSFKTLTISDLQKEEIDIKSLNLTD